MRQPVRGRWRWVSGWGFDNQLSVTVRLRRTTVYKKKLHWVPFTTSSSGGSTQINFGRVSLPIGPAFIIFMQFLRKVGRIIDWCPRVPSPTLPLDSPLSSARTDSVCTLHWISQSLTAVFVEVSVASFNSLQAGPSVNVQNTLSGGSRISQLGTQT